MMVNAASAATPTTWRSLVPMRPVASSPKASSRATTASANKSTSKWSSPPTTTAVSKCTSAPTTTISRKPRKNVSIVIHFTWLVRKTPVMLYRRMGRKRRFFAIRSSCRHTSPAPNASSNGPTSLEINGAIVRMVQRRLVVAEVKYLRIVPMSPFWVIQGVLFRLFLLVRTTFWISTGPRSRWRRTRRCIRYWWRIKYVCQKPSTGWCRGWAIGVKQIVWGIPQIVPAMSANARKFLEWIFKNGKMAVTSLCYKEIVGFWNCEILFKIVTRRFVSKSLVFKNSIEVEWISSFSDFSWYSNGYYTFMQETWEKYLIWKQFFYINLLQIVGFC